MTVPAQRSRRAPNRAGIALRVLLAAALLVPVGVLFASVWQANDEQRSFAERERHGIEYLRSLGQVTLALVDAQSAAIAGRRVRNEDLSRALESTASVDSRYGADLRTNERWAGVRTKIEALPGDATGRPNEVFARYREASDLLLALYAKVRESSGLIRDPAADSYHLQDAAAEELPEALIAAGSLADLAALAAARPQAERLRAVAELTAARSAALDPAGDLVDNLQAAVSNTESRNLSGNLLSQLDSYQRAVEALGSSSALAGTSSVDANEVAAARASTQASGAALSTIILTELDVLIETRIDELTTQRRLAIGALGLATLLIAALIAGTLLAARRRATPEGPPSPPPSTHRPSFGDARAPLAGSGLNGSPLAGSALSGSSPAGAPVGGAALGGAALAGSSLGGAPPLAERRTSTLSTPDGAEPRRRNPTAEWPDPVPAGQGGPPTAAPAPAPLRDNQPTHWGRSDAAR